MSDLAIIKIKLNFILKIFTIKILEAALLEACKAWWAELKDEGFQSSLTVDMNHYNHFSQMAWAETTEIGCGVAKCPKSIWKTYTVCQYNKPLD